MAAVVELTDEEKYLLAILDGTDGIDIAEFCVEEGTLVLTSRGHVPIEEVRLGEQVLTHRGRWRTVTAVLDRGVRDVVTLKGVGLSGLTLTADHRLYARRARQGLRSIEGHRNVFLMDPDWLEAGDAEFGGSGRVRNTRYATPMSVESLGRSCTPEQGWLLGRWLADGSKHYSSRAGYAVSWAIRDRDLAEFRVRVKAAGFDRLTVTATQSAQCWNAVVYQQEFYRWLPAGRAENKAIPTWVLGASDDVRRAVLEGYLSGDGHWSGSNWQASTVSRALAHDLRVLAATLGWSVSVSVTSGGEQSKFGTTVTAQQLWSLTMTDDGGWAEHDGLHQWSMLKSRTAAGQAHVWDLSVEDDHSFVAGGVVVHNCWIDEEQDSRTFRCWDFQWPWYTTEDTLQIDQAGRSLGKSTGIQMRAFAFPFNYAGAEMLITAPELNHLRPLTDAVEGRILASRMAREMLPKRKGNGLARQPHWQATFANGARIISRLPNKDGRGVKGSIGPDVTVLTRRGLIPVQDVLVGDEVLTHTGQWQRVLENIRSEADVDMVEVAGGGHRGLQMSWNHRMWARRNSNPQRTRNLEAPTWVIADDDELPQRWYFGSPTRFPEEPLPALPHPDLDALLTLAGAYVADGCQGTGRIVITDDVDDVARILSYADALGASAAVYDKPSRARTIEIFGTELAAWLREHFGSRAEAKRLPVWLLGADEPYRKAFLNAYLAGDGHWSKSRNRWEASTASRELAVGLRLLGQSLGYSASMSWVDPKPNPLAPAPRRSYRVHLVQGGTVIHDERRHAQWSRVRKVSEIGRGVVYSLIVENDESYLADGIYSHNMHPTVLEGDEMQDFPLAGWIELVETHKRGSAGSQVRFHGVSRGVRDKYWELTQPDSDFRVHHYMAQHRPSWTDQEREEKIKLYQSRQSVDYRRNIYGEHGDASNPVFVLAKLMNCVDSDEGSTYNTEVYTIVRVDFEQIEKGRPIVSFLDPPGEHLHGYSQFHTPDLDNGRTGTPRQVGSPKGYSAYFAGMDVGVTNHPSEILVFGQRKETDVLECLLRVNMRRIGTEDQIEMIEAIFEYYGSKMKAFALDKTGVGQPIWDILQRKSSIGDRIYGYNFSEKVVTGYQDRELGPKETQEDLAIWRNVVEHSTDVLRNDMVDVGRIRIPFDRELLSEWQGQNYTVVKSDGSPYGKRNYSAGKFHTLDAAKMMAAGKTLPAIAAMLDVRTVRAPVLDMFVGANYY